MKKLAIIQSCYIPWQGFFDLVSRCDEYMIYDQVAYSKGHWHNRNRLKTAQGAQWVTIPVSVKGLGQPIEEVEIARPWADRHWMTIRQSYAKAKHFDEEARYFGELYKKLESESFLTNINEQLLRAIFVRLGIKAKVSRDRDYRIEGTRSARVLSACVAAGATHYLSGPSAKDYLDENMFIDRGIEIEWMNYSGYEEYPQLFGDFIPNMSILDVLFNVGARAKTFMGGFESGG